MQHGGGRRTYDDELNSACKHGSMKKEDEVKEDQGLLGGALGASRGLWRFLEASWGCLGVDGSK
eukprot:7239876-Pyramimonas_sp.AAC.1